MGDRLEHHGGCEVATFLVDRGGSRELHVRCDKCGTEVLVVLPEDGRPARDDTPLELIGWRRGIGRRDLCPDCQTQADLPQLGVYDPSAD